MREPCSCPFARTHFSPPPRFPWLSKRLPARPGRWIWGTVGVCDVFPGAVNSIPSRVRIEVDVRDIDQARRDSVLNKIAAACDEVSRRRGVAVRTEVVNADPPAKCGPAVVEALPTPSHPPAFPSDPIITLPYP